jgi:hypothetical protein
MTQQKTIKVWTAEEIRKAEFNFKMCSDRKFFDADEAEKVIEEEIDKNTAGSEKFIDCTPDELKEYILKRLGLK